MKPPSPHTATTFFCGYNKETAIADGNPAPMVAKALSSSNVFGSYACRIKGTALNMLSDTATGFVIYPSESYSCSIELQSVSL